MKRFLRGLASDDAGATAIEYALIASLISVAIIAGATSIGNSLSTTFSNIGGSL